MVISRLVLQAALVQFMSAPKDGSPHTRHLAAGGLPALRCCENMVLQYYCVCSGTARNTLALDMKTAARSHQKLDPWYRCRAAAAAAAAVMALSSAAGSMLPSASVRFMPYSCAHAKLCCQALKA